MSSYLGYKYSTCLSEDERIKIDTSVLRNRKAVYIFVTKHFANSKRRAKRVTLVITLGSAVWFKCLSADAIGLTPIPSHIEKVQQNDQYSSEIDIAKIFVGQKDRMSLSYKDRLETLYIIYLNDPRIASDQQILAMVTRIRGGDLGLTGAIFLAGVIILILSLTQGFGPQPVNPGWGLERPNPFQPHDGMYKYPPYRNLFSPRGTCMADRPGSSPIMSGVNLRSSRHYLTQVSRDYIPTKPQIEGFMKNGKVDLRACYNEVLRRAEQLDYNDFESTCSFERFKNLSTVNGKVTKQAARESITVLEGEMHRYYKNACRVNYGEGIEGLDYAVEGLDGFEHITHVDVKNAVGSAIKLAENQNPNIRQQGRKIGKRSLWQKKFWSNTTRLNGEFPNLNPDAYLPQSPNNAMTVLDCFDVPTFEKAVLQEGFESGSKYDTNSVFLNNVTNL